MVRLKRFVSLLLMFGTLALSSGLAVTAEESGNKNSRNYSENAVQKWLDPVFDGAAASSGFGNPHRLIAGDTAEYTVTVKTDGEYKVMLVYRAINSAVAMDNTVELNMDGKNYNAQLPAVWYDAERGLKDRSGNEIIPEQKTVDDYCKCFLTDASGINKSDLVLSLSAGTHSYKLCSKVQDIEIGGIYFVPVSKISSYSETVKGKKIKHGADTVTVEAEHYSLKSDSYIRSANVQKNTVTPYKTYKKLLNVLSGDSWSTAGQKVLWEFEIKNSGWYHIGTNYQQSSNTELPVYRKIEIDGKVPFAEWENHIFESTGSNKYKTSALKVDGKDAWVYLDKGMHTVAMTVSVGELEKVYEEILSLISDMNDLGTTLLKLTAGESDANRTWDIDAYMPNIQDDIYKFADRIDEIYKETQKITDKEAVYADDLKYAAELVRKFASDKKTIPNNTDMLCRGDNSATTYLINVIGNITAQSLTLDKIYIYGDKEPKQQKTGFFTSLFESVKRFVYSFTAAAVSDDYGVSEKEDDQLKVWVGQTPMCVSIMQQMVDATYNKEHGTDIRLVVMPSEQKLILANSVGNNPDLVISSVTPYKYAIRGAAKNLLDYDDFLDYYTKEYSIESLVPMYYNGGVYGVNETRNFSVLFYRKDTLSSLGLSVPKTWDDVRSMMPTLLRNSMNFSLPTSGGGAYAIGNVAPFILQNNGQIYAEDGMTAAIDSENTITAIQEITDFYKIYGVQQSVASFFNSFRYNQIPIGIGGYDFYLQLNMAAPELNGIWDIAPVPGTLREDGSISRDYGCNGSASMIFENSKKHEEAWDFLKWWLSSKTQTEYSRKRQTGYGASYLWNSANKVTFETLPFSSEHKAVIREQFANQQEVAEHPASYIVAREIGNVWNNVVISNKSLVDNINSSTILCNREFRRKLQEFGFIDKDGKIIKEYSTNALAELKRLQEGK